MDISGAMPLPPAARKSGEPSFFSSRAFQTK
jgi:hypothetical protein